MSVEDISQRVRDFLAPHFHGHQLGDGDDIFALGFVNSLFAMQLVMFVEKEFGLKLEPDDLEIDNFRSISAVVGLVDARADKVVP
ncbi:MAG TPA: acyl carrier protein [Candidatus Limnocylindrales bacterium]|nr:acyl carrier protein [Candidatus Limnocylindrales bacterium]